MHIMNDHIKTRFSPSPTGLMHLGNARTALFSALFAKKMHGTFLLRIEDTDPERSKQEYADLLMSDLQWMGLHWQEGPEYQSQRHAVYHDYYERLAVEGMSFPCFCSEDELSLARKLQQASGKPPRYPGTCRNLSEEQIAGKLAQGLLPVLRFKVLEDEVIEYTDFVKGSQKFNSNDIGDFVIRRADGTATFVFCNAIDDALMQVTHVMRGEDHVTNTPRQLMILEALGLKAPAYGHISLITGQDGSPLSKRNGSRSIEELRLEGYLSEAVINYLARLGHYYGHDQLLSLDELAVQFTLDKLSKSPAKFNPAQLDFWQKEAVNNLEAHLLWDWLQHEDRVLIPEEHRQRFFEFIKPNIQSPQQLKEWVHIFFHQMPALTPEQIAVLQEAGADYFLAALEAIDQFGCDYKKVMDHIALRTGVKGKKLYQPLRVALTGQLHGPELAELLMIIVLTEVKHRLEKAQSSC